MKEEVVAYNGKLYLVSRRHFREYQGQGLFNNPDNDVQVIVGNETLWVDNKARLREISEEDWRSRRALIQMGRPIVERLGNLLQNSELGNYQRYIIVETLGMIGVKEAEDMLIAALDEDHISGYVRDNVLHTLGIIGETKAVPRIIELIEQEATKEEEEISGYPINNGYEALGRIGGGQAVSFLIRQLDSMTPHLVLEELINALRDVGPDAKPAIPKLKELRQRIYNDFEAKRRKDGAKWSRVEYLCQIAQEELEHSEHPQFPSKFKKAVCKTYGIKQ